jgi:hypothetical protein
MDGDVKSLVPYRCYITLLLEPDSALLRRGMAHSSSIYGRQPSAQGQYTPVNFASDTGFDQQGTSKNRGNFDPSVYETRNVKELYKISERKWELLAWIAGAVIIAGTVCILTRFNNTPVEEWPISIQISTVVAFLAQVAQAALL